jgi:hypothetical protein
MRSVSLGSTLVFMLQLYRSYSGTPNDSEWPGLDGLPHWRNSFPLWAKQIEWDSLMQELPKEGRELVEVLIILSTYI